MGFVGASRLEHELQGQAQAKAASVAFRLDRVSALRQAANRFREQGDTYEVVMAAERGVGLPFVHRLCVLPVCLPSIAFPVLF